MYQINSRYLGNQTIIKKKVNLQMQIQRRIMQPCIFLCVIFLRFFKLFFQIQNLFGAIYVRQGLRQKMKRILNVLSSSYSST